MKKHLYTLILIGILFLNMAASGQKTVVPVLPDEEGLSGSLNTAISAAVAAGTAGSSIFELQRGGIYRMSGAITNTGYTLHIRAEEGSGPRPAIQAAKNTRHFVARGELILEGLYLNQKFTDDTYTGNQTIRVDADNVRFTADDCFFDYVGKEFIRILKENTKVYVTNSIFRNAGSPADMDYVHVVATRDNSTDTISIVNSTMYNCSNILIYTGPVSVINALIFNHNTVYQSNWANSLGTVFGENYMNNFPLGKSIKAWVTNNIFYNFAYRTDITKHQALFSVDSIGENDSERMFDLSNNNWYTEPEIGQALIDHSTNTNFRLKTDLFLNPEISIAPPAIKYFIDNGQVTSTNIISEPLTFKNAPSLQLEFWEYWIKNDYAVFGDVPTFVADEDPGVVGEVETGAYNFSYTDNAISATAAAGGLPLGDPRWVPYSSVSTENHFSISPNSVKVYPNPFAENLTFKITANESSSANIKVFDLTGKEIFAVKQRLNQGHNDFSFNLGDIHSGIYFYQVQFESPNNQKTSLSGKIFKR